MNELDDRNSETEKRAQLRSIAINGSLPSLLVVKTLILETMIAAHIPRRCHMMYPPCALGIQ